MTERVSVIMPAYNLEDYIQESIASVLQQTYRDFELIVVDDGSTDRTADIVRACAANDARIRLVTEENGGVSVARNTGIAQARGAYVTFLDGDDLWNPECLARLVQRMEETNGSFVYGRTEEFFEDGKTQLVGPSSLVEGRLERFLAKTGELRLRSHISAVLVRKTLLDTYEIRFPVGIKQSEDTAFFIQLLCVTDAYGVSDILTRYRRRGSSATRAAWRPEDWSGAVVIYETLEPFVKAQAPEQLAAFYCMRNYVAYRFCLRCIRRQFVDEAAQYIARWRDALRDFASGTGKLGDRLKCRALLAAAPNTAMLRLVGRL